MKFSRLLNQTAVYWGNPVHDGYGGKTFDAGTEIDVRWEDKIVSFINSQGEEVISRSIVYAEQDLDVNGYLFLGEIDNLSVSSAESDPTQEPNAFEIQQVLKSPNVKGTVFLRKAML